MVKMICICLASMLTFSLTISEAEEPGSVAEITWQTDVSVEVASEIHSIINRALVGQELEAFYQGLLAGRNSAANRIFETIDKSNYTWNIAPIVNPGEASELIGRLKLVGITHGHVLRKDIDSRLILSKIRLTGGEDAFLWIDCSDDKVSIRIKATIDNYKTKQPIALNAEMVAAAQDLVQEEHAILDRYIIIARRLDTVEGLRAADADTLRKDTADLENIAKQFMALSHHFNALIPPPVSERVDPPLAEFALKTRKSSNECWDYWRVTTFRRESVEAELARRSGIPPADQSAPPKSNTTLSLSGSRLSAINWRVFTKKFSNETITFIVSGNVQLLDKFNDSRDTWHGTGNVIGLDDHGHLVHMASYINSKRDGISISSFAGDNLGPHSLLWNLYSNGECIINSNFLWNWNNNGKWLQDGRAIPIDDK